MAALGIRGFNPIWLLDDLQGNLFDDTFWMFVLENTIPYIPVSVYHDPEFNTPWTNPIRFLGNGTLPVDIYWETGRVYRLEFRQHIGGGPPTQADPLIYEVNNYMASNGGGITPIEDVGLFTDNQITNAQFSLISFYSPTTFTGLTDEEIEVAPGWFLELGGSGDVELEQVPLNSTLENPTNAPYALRILTTGSFSSVRLRQRFQQNGMLWANKYVSSSLTARIEGAPQSISSRLVDSMGQVLVVLLDPTAINSTFNEYQGFGLVPDTSNTDTPPDAWIDYQIILPTTAEIYITSLQLIASDIATNFPYDQDTIDRQIDHTWHYYKNEVILKPKDTVLTGWNFSINPFQFNSASVTTAATQTQYVADQTIIHQIAAGGTIATGKASVGNRECFLAKAISGFTFNRFALIQYIDPQTIKPYWSYLMSSLARARIFTSHGTQVGIKMRLIYSASLPGIISSTDPISSWTGTNPVFALGWTEIEPLNDPEYILLNSYAAGEGNAAFPAFNFDAFQLPDMTSSAMTLGIVIYLTGDLNSASGTEDSVAFDRISLVPNAFAVDTNPKTFDQCLRECQFYYEKSYSMGVLPGSVSVQDMLTKSMLTKAESLNNGIRLTNLSFEYNTIKRITLGPTRVSFFSPSTGVQGNVYGVWYDGGVDITSGDISASNFSPVQVGQKTLTYSANTGGIFLPVAIAVTTPWSVINFHYVVDARLGTGI